LGVYRFALDICMILISIAGLQVDTILQILLKRAKRLALQIFYKMLRTFIATLDDSLRIAQEGKQARAEALIELHKTEKELKDALLAVKARAEEVPELIEKSSEV